MEEGNGSSLYFYALSLCSGRFLIWRINMNSKKNLDVKRLVLLAMFAALAYAVSCATRVEVGNFLTYEAKDVIIVIAGLILGPMATLIISAVTALIEMATLTFSVTGLFGCVMDFLSSASFAFTVTMVYKYRRTLAGAIGGLALGSVVMVATMLLWNWLITPLYLKIDRQIVVGMLGTLFLPFNAVKALLNSALVLCLYKPLITALRKARLVSTPTSQEGGFKLGLYLLAAAALATGILMLLVLQGKI